MIFKKCLCDWELILGTGNGGGTLGGGGGVGLKLCNSDLRLLKYRVITIVFLF
jgi:hypothetical protein